MREPLAATWRTSRPVSGSEPVTGVQVAPESPVRRMPRWRATYTVPTCPGTGTTATGGSPEGSGCRVQVAPPSVLTCSAVPVPRL